MVELNPTVREQEIYEEMELTPEMVKSIRTPVSYTHLHRISRLYVACFPAAILPFINVQSFS